MQPTAVVCSISWSYMLYIRHIKLIWLGNRTNLVQKRPHFPFRFLWPPAVASAYIYMCECVCVFQWHLWYISHSMATPALPLTFLFRDRKIIWIQVVFQSVVESLVGYISCVNCLACWVECHSSDYPTSWKKGCHIIVSGFATQAEGFGVYCPLHLILNILYMTPGSIHQTLFTNNTVNVQVCPIQSSKWTKQPKLSPNSLRALQLLWYTSLFLPNF